VEGGDKIRDKEKEKEKFFASLKKDIKKEAGAHTKKNQWSEGGGLFPKTGGGKEGS